MESHKRPRKPVAFQENESAISCAGVAMRRYFRPGSDGSLPLFVFLPGGGHLARVAYGHEGCARQDFIDHWLAMEGASLLALSPPVRPPATCEVRPDLTLSEWAAAVAEATAETIDQDARSGRVAILAWSLSARCAGLLTNALNRMNIEVDAFMPMAGSPPLFGEFSIDPTHELFLENGLWDVHRSPVGGMPRGEVWARELSKLAADLGREVIPPAEYSEHYCSGTPIGMLGNPSFAPGRVLQPLHLHDFPLAAPISPTSLSDYRHAIADVSSWGIVNAAVIDRNWLAPRLSLPGSISRERWERGLRLIEKIPCRLHRRVEGGHLFFVGEPGARATCLAVLELLTETKAIRSELDQLFGPGGSSLSADVGTSSECELPKM